MKKFFFSITIQSWLKAIPKINVHLEGKKMNKENEKIL